MCLSRMRARVKNRIHGALLRYNVDIAVSDLFGDQGRAELLSHLDELPRHSRASVPDRLPLVDTVETEIAEREAEIKEMLYPRVERDLLDTLPCVGPLLSAVLALELGDARRFPGPAWLASYAGLVPAARESADGKKQGGWRAGLQRVSEVGLCGGGQSDRRASQAVVRAARGTAV